MLKQLISCVFTNFFNVFTKKLNMRTLLKPPKTIPKNGILPFKLKSNLLDKKDSTLRSSFNKVIFSLIIMLLSTILPSSLKAQSQTNETIWNGFGYSLKKVVSNNSVPSGVNFSYTILFTAPAGATTVNIQDQIPSALVVVNVPTPAIVNGVTPVVATTGPVGSQVVTYSLTGLPVGSPSSGSFTIVVKFPEGTTCNGATARNRAGIQINSDYNYTGYVSTTATAVDPWVISKTILSGPVVNPNGGNCGYQMNTNTTVTYRLAIMKANGYWGNAVGQMNMNSASVSDIFPAGAVVGTLPAGVTISLNTITWTPNAGLLDAANAWAYYWVDIPVTYPAGPFPNGSFVYNQATLTGAICQQQVSHSSNQTCIEIANVVPAPGGYFQKWVSVQNRVPGCPGSYTIYFCNNGNVPLSAFNINDAIPSGVAVTSVQFYYASPTTTVNITANGGANTLVTGLNANSWSSGNIGYPVNNIQFAMTGSLPVGQCLYIIVNFTINPNPVGTVVTNCATFNGLSNGLTLPNACASFTVAAAQPDPCLVKDICAPQTDYEPGDIIRMRLRVQNIGSAALTGATIQDVLNPSFTYLGNESYFISNSYSPACGPGIPAGTTAWTGVTPNHSGNNLSWNIPSIPSACQFFAVAYCGYYGTWGLDYYYIEFDVQVNGTALPGITPNNYNISGGNLPATVTSNTINVLIVASFGQEVEKQVSTDNGVTFASSGTVTPGSTAKYRLNYKNTSNVPVSTVNLVDLLAKDDGPLNDWLILNRSVSRGSQFDITYGASPATSLLPVAGPPTPVINFAAGENICLPPYGITLGCTGTTWALAPVTENIRFNYGTFSLLSNTKLRQDFNVNIPANATPQQTVCNDFAAIATANFLLNGNPTAVALTPIAAPPVCLTVTSANLCCDSVKVEQYSNTGAPGCCARIQSKCEIKSINISLYNGTFSSASWNCGAIPPAYIGQSSFTFAPGTCAPLDLITCFTPTQPGTVIVSYTINFANGQTCTKTLDVNCSSTSINCCDSVKVESYSNAAAPGCCAKLHSTCEIKAVHISLGNGTFNSASSSCGPLAPGYVGQSSWTFAPGNCAPVDLITCVTPIQPGYVVVNYTIYFANGDSCHKVLDLNCTSTINCCDSIKISNAPGADGVVGCCTQIESKCDVEKIEVAISNGTLSSASWNCGPIPAGYVGQSNYTFTANGCAVILNTCIDPITSGYVTITYTVYLSNGDICEKDFRLDCTATSQHCCDSVKVESYSDATTQGCCALLHSTCEIKSVKISLGNGTFSSASSNCGTLTPGYVGQSSWTFAPGNCTPVDLITCVTPVQPGYVIVNYTIYFANGDSCQKVLDLNCTATSQNCCDSVRVESYSDPVAAGCCAKLSSLCEIKSVDISLGNGTFSSASSNCGPLAPGYVGQSSYTFVPGNCAPVDLITCVTPTQPGYVVVNYTIHFANGDSCHKVLDLNCSTPTYDCCDSIRVGQTHGANGVLDCCTRIKSKCDVEKVDIALSNGTFSSASWNCGPIPAGYVGQSNYTFIANGCPVDLTTCYDATQTGSVGITYTITLSDGTVCVKEFKINCTATAINCCDSVKVESYSDATAPGCCAKLHSTCEIKAVKISLNNGTFSSASSNCGPLAPGYIGQSTHTFAPGNCAPVDLVTCFTAIQPGYIIANYTIYFANGDSCHKVLDLNCPTSSYDCCDSIRVSSVPGTNGVVACCAKIESKCDVDKVDVAITNGTLSSASWNCGPVPAGYVGQSNFTFAANGCALDLVTCIDAIQTGSVTIKYTVTLSNGDVCVKEYKLDCAATPHCCDSVKVETVKNPDGTANCCAKVKTTCEVKSIKVDVSNGTLGSSSWNCGALPNGYIGQSSYTFSPNGCAVDLTTCVDAIQSGVVVVSYTITFLNGETCKKSIELNCNVSTACCALVDFKLKQKWPKISTQVGTFNITNLDPSSPICKVEIYPSPAATFTPGTLVVDGVTSGQAWTSSLIPTSGTLTNPAVNTISFSMVGVNYHGVVTICVVKCDGTRCCFDFKWNKSPLTGVVISLNQLSIGDKLVAVSVNPKVTNNKERNVKYVSFGFRDQTEVDNAAAEFFAISASEYAGEEYPASLAAPVNAYMGKYNAFFELPKPVPSGNDLGAFNLVFTGKLPKLGCTLFSENGDIVFNGNVEVSVTGTVITSSLDPSQNSNMFEFINVFPNPSDGVFTLTYANSENRDVEISVVNERGQIMKKLQRFKETPGIHKLSIDMQDYPVGMYNMVLTSGGKILSKSAVKK
jgi:uncharacterized repeat protein (TIGR01451 family)